MEGSNLTEFLRHARLPQRHVRGRLDWVPTPPLQTSRADSVRLSTTLSSAPHGGSARLSTTLSSAPHGASVVEVERAGAMLRRDVKPPRHTEAV
jgi:hypothetical protein